MATRLNLYRATIKVDGSVRWRIDVAAGSPREARDVAEDYCGPLAAPAPISVDITPRRSAGRIVEVLA